MVKKEIPNHKLAKAERHWGISRKQIMYAIRRLRHPKIKGLATATQVLSFLVKTIPRRVSQKEFSRIVRLAVFLRRYVRKGRASVHGISEIIATYISAGVYLSMWKLKALFRKAIKASKSLAPQIVKNFPNEYPLSKKVLANTMFYVGDRTIHKRKPFLTQNEYEGAKKVLKKADIVLVGNLRRASSIFIGGPITHSLIYAGNEDFVHAKAEGVQPITLTELIEQYDNLMVLRSYSRSDEKLKNAVKYAKKQMGKPYDFEFTYGDDKFYCTKLVFASYREAQIKLKIRNNSGSRELFSDLLKREPLHPLDFMKANVRTVYKSPNLVIENNEVSMSR
jgi:uncharacterized protein YycO